MTLTATQSIAQSLIDNENNVSGPDARNSSSDSSSKSGFLESSGFFSDVYMGLSGQPKRLPCKYFYDDIGSELFERICELEEYYVTRTENQLLADVAEDISAYLGDNLTIIEPGAGAAKKVQILMRHLNAVRRFVPLEISQSALDFSVSSVRKNFPGLDVVPLQGDFTNAEDLKVLSHKVKNNNNLIFFPGSTIGNFERVDAVAVLRNLKTLVGSKGYILVGVDLVKSRKVLVDAYDDALGVTAEFNKNLLTRINRELNADFDIKNGFDHTVKYSEEHNRIEMYLKSTRSQHVKIGDRYISFEKDELVHTENSHKYTVGSFSSLASEADLNLVDCWKDQGDKFCLFLLQSVD